MKLKMESTSGNGKTPKTAVTSTDNGLQQNGSAMTRDSSNRNDGKIHHQQNGSSSSAKMHRSSKTANVTTTAMSSTSLSLPTPATSAPIAGSSSISSSWARFTSSLPLRLLKKFQLNFINCYFVFILQNISVKRFGWSDNWSRWRHN